MGIPLNPESYYPNSSNNRRAKLRVELVYWFERSPLSLVSRRARLARLWGSDAMRLQIHEAIAPHLPDNIELTFSGLSFGDRLRPLYFNAWLKTRRPAVFILLKNVAYRMTADELMHLKDRAIAVGVDHKDADPSRLDLSHYDFHISATESGRRAIDAMLSAGSGRDSDRPFAAAWYQSYDRRLENLQSPGGLDRLESVYMGQRNHASVPEGLANDITFLDVYLSEDMDRAVRVLGNYNFHFAVRPSPPQVLRRAYKPFTKGSTAAACGANILVNRQVDDAIEFLTPNYPYLVQSDAPEHVEEGFRKAREEVGGPEWRRGLEIMRSVRERVSGPAQARQFVDFVTRAAS